MANYSCQECNKNVIIFKSLCTLFVQNTKKCVFLKSSAIQNNRILYICVVYRISLILGFCHTANFAMFPNLSEMNNFFAWEYDKCHIVLIVLFVSRVNFATFFFIFFNVMNSHKTRLNT